MARGPTSPETEDAAPMAEGGTTIFTIPLPWTPVSISGTQACQSLPVAVRRRRNFVSICKSDHFLGEHIHPSWRAEWQVFGVRAFRTERRCFRTSIITVNRTLLTE